MATKRAKEFLTTVNNDVVLRQKLGSASTPEERRAIINAAGFSDVTKEDIQQALHEKGEVTKAHVDAVGELSDAELEAVAGGATTAWLTAIILITLA